jgi:hypothetical protein
MLVSQFLLESLVVNLLSLFIAIAATWLIHPYFQSLTNTQVDYIFGYQWQPLLMLAAVFVGGVCLSGLYPGMVLASFHPISALKGKIAFQLLIYPATDQRGVHPSHQRNGRGYLLTTESMNYFRASYLPRSEDWTDWRASPLLAPSLKGVAPAFLLTAGFDPLQDEGREYAERLRREGVEVEYRDYADMIHGFIVMGGVLDTANAAVADCCAALRRAFEKVTA